MQNRLEEAGSVLDGAKAVNSTQLGLWALYGDLNVRRGDLAAAEADYRKELDLHPDFTPVYPPLARVQIAASEQDQALATLRKWQAAEPDNARPTAILMNILEDSGKPADAVKAGEAEAARSAVAGSDPSLLFYLASAECKVGNWKKGVAMLEQVLQTGDLTLKNSAAYTLADLNVDLPLADPAERNVMERLGLVTEGWTLGGDLAAQRSTTTALVAVWDTMGWILFREGKLAEAENFVRAAWWNSPNAVVGEHLGEIQAARGNHRAALEDFQIAQATLPKTLMPGSEASQIAADLQKKIAAEQTGGVRSTLGDPHAALVKLRTLKLAHAEGVNGTAWYGVLMSRGGIAGALQLVPAGKAPPGGKTLPGGVAVLGHAQVPQFFPEQDYTQLVHIGVLRCDGRTCEFEIEQ